MPRRGNVPKRDVLPDSVYGSKILTKFINQVMYDGKRGTAQEIVYGAFDMISSKMGKDPMEVFTQALENVKPVLEVKARRVGGSTYQVPMEIRPERRQTLAIRWIVMFARGAKRPWWNASPPSLWMLTTIPVTPSSVRKICTEWQKRTRRSRTIAGNQLLRINIWLENLHLTK